MKPKQINWSSTPRPARKRPILEGCTVAPEVLDALNDYLVRHKRKKSEVVEAALRQYLGMEKRNETT